MEFSALSEVFQRVNFVHAERDDFKVGHLFDELQVLELIAPKIQVLYVVQVVRFGFIKYELEGERLAFCVATHV